MPACALHEKRDPTVSECDEMFGCKGPGMEVIGGHVVYMGRGDPGIDENKWDRLTL